MGIQPKAAGWKAWVARPAPGDLAFANIVVPTPAGPIAANFTRANATVLASSGFSASLSLRIPASTAATVCMPTLGANPEDVLIKVDGSVQPNPIRENRGAYLCTSPLLQKLQVVVEMIVART